MELGERGWLSITRVWQARDDWLGAVEETKMRYTQRHTRRRGSACGGFIFAALLLLAGCSLGSGEGWERAGYTGGHIVLSLAADPFLKQVYAGTDSGMIYRLRTDRADALRESDGLPQDGVISTILPDPHTQGLVYAGGNHGLFVTTDGGAHWQARGTGFPAGDTMGALIAGSNQHTLIAGSQEHGIYISHDEGATWQPSSAGMRSNANIYTLLDDQASHTIYAAVDGVGVFASTDEGQSWSVRSMGLPTHIFALVELPNHGLDPSGTTLYAGTEQGLYASVDDGAHWTPAGPIPATSRVLSLAADPSTPGVLYAGTDVTVFRSSDGGRTWHGVARGLNTHIASLLVAHGIVFAGTSELVRYPPRNGAGVENGIINLLFLLALGGIGFLLLRRSRIRMRQMEQRTRRETAERMARMRSARENAGEDEANEHMDEGFEESVNGKDGASATEPQRDADGSPR